jgi:hypothetical protein
MTVSNRFSTGLCLAGLGFLGFYLFGLIMGVYSATEVPYFTIPAGVIAVAFAIYLARGGRPGAADSSDQGIQESRHLRERRGF